VLSVDSILKLKIEGSAKAASESSESESDSDGGKASVAAAVAPSLKIKINPKARKSGRPKTDKKQRAVDEAMERVRFNAAQITHQQLAVDSLQTRCSSLPRNSTPTSRALRRLATCYQALWPSSGRTLGNVPSTSCNRTLYATWTRSTCCPRL
jgi:hypothetical protein